MYLTIHHTHKLTITKRTPENMSTDAATMDKMIREGEAKFVLASMDDAEADHKVEDVVVSKEIEAHVYKNIVAGSSPEEAAARRAKASILKMRFEEEPALAAYVEALPEKEQAVFFTVETVERFLVASDMKEKKAEEMLVATLKWRAKHKPFQIKFKDVKECLDAGSVFVAGKCKAGRPIFYMSVGTVNKFPAVKRIQLVAYLLEESARRGHEQLTWIFNFARLGENRGTDPEAKKARKLMMEMCQNNYPERLGALHLINTPWFLGALATIVWPFVDKGTKAKVNMKCTVPELLNYVDKSELLDEFGGDKVRPSVPFADEN